MTLASTISVAQGPMMNSVCPFSLITTMSLSVSRAVLVFPVLSRRHRVLVVIVVVVRPAEG